MHFAEITTSQDDFSRLARSDGFDYEFQMTGMNRRLKPRIETVFLWRRRPINLFPHAMVKEIVGLGGDIGQFRAAAGGKTHC